MREVREAEPECSEGSCALELLTCSVTAPVSQANTNKMTRKLLPYDSVFLGALIKTPITCV